jgi:hypothetical protein
LLSVEPPSGTVDAANPVTIRGEGFALKVFTDFGDSANTRVDARYAVAIGGVSLLNVRRDSDTALSGTVPAGLAQGVHDVQVTDPYGRTATLSGGYLGLPAGGVADHVELPSGRTLEVFTCLQVTARLLNDDDEAVPASADTDVALATAPPGILETFSDTACTQASSTVTVARGQSSVTFSIRGIARGAVRLTASVAGLASDSANYVVGPTAVVFTTAPASVVAGACSPALTVQTRNPAGAASVVPSDTTVDLTSNAASGFAFFSGAGCAGSPVAGVTIPAGSSAATFSFRGSAVGPVTVTAAATGLVSQQQTHTITVGPAARFSFAAVGPQGENTPFLITLRTTDQFGNPVNTFTGSATLSAQGGSALTCLAGCASATTTASFVAGAWSGWVALATAGAGRSIQAQSGSSISGTSSTFDVLTAASTLPQARLRVSPAVVNTNGPGGTVTVDAFLSSDYDTPASALEVSFDCSGASGNPPGGGGGWTAWSTTKTETCIYNMEGTYFPRVAVRDVGGASSEVAYATAMVVGLPNGVTPCVVNTVNDADDNATSCAGAAGQFGPDGVLSLAEAIRLASASSGRKVITASGPLRLVPRLAAVANQTLSGDMELVFPSGTVIDSYGLTVTGGSVTVANAEITGSRPWRVTGGALTLSDAQVHDLPTIVSAVRLSVNRVEAWNCPAAAPCLQAEGPTGQLWARFSQFFAAPGGAVRVAPLTTGGACPAVALDLQSCTFSGIAGVGADVACTSNDSRVVHSTFHGTGTGVRFTGGAGHLLQNNLFSSSAVAAVSCGAATFGAPGAMLGNTAYQNVSSGCLSSTADPELLTGDPVYILAGAGDLRLGGTAATSAKEAVSPAADLGLDLNDVAPGSVFGSAPDRGGRETP